MRPLVKALISQQLTSMNSLVARAISQMEREWVGLQGDFDDDAMERWVKRSVPIALGTQGAAGALTDAFLSMLLSEMTGQPTRPAGLARAVYTGEALRGKTLEEVWQRPILQARFAASKGLSGEQARLSGLDRARTLIETDVRLAQRAVASEVFSRTEGITGYRRTLTGGSCDLCNTASEKVYRTGDLMPIHSKCDCGVVPILGDNDPGDEYNSGIRPAVEEPAPVESNDELGPMFEN